MLLYNKNIRNSSLHVPPVGMVFFNNIFWFSRDIKCLAVHKSHTLIIDFSNVFKINNGIWVYFIECYIGT